MTSPDPEYQTKQTRIIRLRESTKTNGSAVMLYQDEVTYYRAPSTARSYGASGQDQPTTSVDHTTHRSARIAAAMDAHSGRVEYLHGTSIGTDKLISFYEQIAEAFSSQNQIYMVQDNWPVHFHPAVMKQLETQHVADRFPVVDNWQDNTKAIQADGPIPIQVIPLPTYAPWLNPIEKLWRWLKQNVIHMHSFGQAWSTLKTNVQQFLDRFSTGSTALLEYTGLLPE